MLIKFPPVLPFKRLFPALILGLLTMAVSPSSAETIRLKNGRSIVADSVRETEKRVEYTIGEDTYAISKTLVERIDTGGVPVVTRRDPQIEAALPPPSVDDAALRGPVGLQERIVHDGKVDIEALAAAEAAGPAEASALSNF